MHSSTPAWFSVEKTFQIGRGWYIGDIDALNIGPYSSQSEAEHSGQTISRRIAAVKTSEAKNALIREFLQEEWEKVDKTRSAEGRKSVSDQQSEYSVRNDERAKNWFRADRIYNVSSEWFFSTREGIQIGPFPTREEAEIRKSDLVSILSSVDDPFVVLLTIREFKNRWSTH